ncbi:metallophosphoesterase [Lacticaseibacillus parakribbianus]|uniref:metallophosphoesterase n=1 Tax=Lacticaseibacillus parakribbianus TaxID=2970927 RepID=UPI0021CB7059|nr:metallophosphoesterase [Lacticaseibacillus parakribbianus]
MKRLLTTLAALLGLAAIAWGLVALAPRPPRPVPALTASATPRLWVMSDTHFIAPSLHDGKAAFTAIKQSAAGKDLDYQPVALRAFVHQALAAKPTAVIITGDVTFNGELISAKSLVRRFAKLTQAGIPLLVIPGNHDIYDGWARQYRGKRQLKTAQIGPDDWRDVFKASYAHAQTVDPDSLSYTVLLNHDYELLMLDSNIYPIQPSATNPNTGGELSPKTLAWLRRQLAAAKKAGRTPLVFMHHNLYVHNQVVHHGYVLNNTDQLQKLLTRYQVPVLFSGHIHAQDIAQDPAGRCTTTEIVSGSFSVTPGGYGVVSLSPTKLRYQRRTVDLTPVLTKTERQNPDLLHYQRYLRHLFAGNGERLAVESLYQRKDITDKQLVAAANFIGELNRRFFAGEDSPTASELAKLHQSLGYRVAVKVPRLRQYIQSVIQDHNLNDLDYSRTITR